MARQNGVIFSPKTKNEDGKSEKVGWQPMKIGGLRRNLSTMRLPVKPLLFLLLASVSFNPTLLASQHIERKKVLKRYPAPGRHNDYRNGVTMTRTSEKGYAPVVPIPTGYGKLQERLRLADENNFDHSLPRV